MHFAEPSWLWAGAACVVGLSVLVAWSERQRSRALARFVAARHLSGLTSSASKPRRWLKHTLRVLGVGCLFLALARPQWGYHFESEKRQGVDVLFAVDSSKSMLARDLRPSRLVRAKLAVEELADQLPGARLGLIAFAGDAFLQTPLTADRVAFQRSLDALDTSAIPIPGTNLQSAIRVAKQAFRSEPAQRKIVVLVTDGEDLSDSVAQAGRTAADSGIVVHALGVGTSAGATIPVDQPKGGDALLRDPSGELVRSRLDEAALRELSSATRGSYHLLGASGQGARELHRDALSQLPTQLHEVSTRKVFYERFQWPLGIGMVLLLLSWLVNEQRARSFVGTARARQLAAVSGALVCMQLALSSVAAAQDRSKVATYNDASERYRAGDFEAAAGAYRDALATADVELQERAYYDLGNSLYRQGEASEPKSRAQAMERYNQAISAYESALALDANDEDARYNRDFVRAKLKELEQQQQQQADKQDGNDQQQQADKQDGNDQQQQADKQDGNDQDQGGKSGADDKPSDASAADQQPSKNQQRSANAAAESGKDEASEPGQEPSSHANGKDRDTGDPQREDRAQAEPQQGRPEDRAQTQRDTHAQAQADTEPGDEQRSAAGTTATAAELQPGAAAVAGGLTGDQAARLLDALEGELQQLPSGYAALRADTKQDEQTRKDW